MKDHFLNTTEFSSITGISANNIAKYLRDGRLKGEKTAGKWMIPESELKSSFVTGSASAAKQTALPFQSPDPNPETDGLSISEFSRKSYLTESGVLQWLAKGRLQGRKSDNGQWRISLSNMEDPGIKRLLR